MPAVRETFGATNPSSAAGCEAPRRAAARWCWPPGSRAGARHGLDPPGSANLTAADIVGARDDSLKRLRTEVIDLYQIHWPARNVAGLGAIYFDPSREPRGQQHPHPARGAGHAGEGGQGAPRGPVQRVAPRRGRVQWRRPRRTACRAWHGAEPYALTSRRSTTGSDEVMHCPRCRCSPTRPLAFGALTGKYDEVACTAARAARAPGDVRDDEEAALGRPEALEAAKFLQRAGARKHGLTPTQLALAFCYTNWRGEHHHRRHLHGAQLDENPRRLELTTLAPSCWPRSTRSAGSTATRLNRGGARATPPTRHAGGCARGSLPSGQSVSAARRARPGEELHAQPGERRGLRGALRGGSHGRFDALARRAGRHCQTTECSSTVARWRAAASSRRPTPRHRRRRRRADHAAPARSRPAAIRNARRPVRPDVLRRRSTAAGSLQRAMGRRSLLRRSATAMRGRRKWVSGRASRT